MIDPRYRAEVEPVDKSWRVKLHTTQHYYVVEAWYKGVRQEYYRTTIFVKASKNFEKLVLERQKK